MAKIEILLAAAKARAIYLNEPDGLLPIEIIATGIMASGSVKSSLKKLFDAHKIKRDKEGRYFIPAYRIPELVKQFTNANL
jgi:DNA-binding transcriptional ArsR family regulator